MEKERKWKVSEKMVCSFSPNMRGRRSYMPIWKNFKYPLKGPVGFQFNLCFIFSLIISMWIFFLVTMNDHQKVIRWIMTLSRHASIQDHARSKSRQAINSWKFVICFQYVLLPLTIQLTKSQQLQGDMTKKIWSIRRDLGVSLLTIYWP